LHSFLLEILPVDNVSRFGSIWVSYEELTTRSNMAQKDGKPISHEAAVRGKDEHALFGAGL
jgi:hypothetical protein